MYCKTIKAVDHEFIHLLTFQIRVLVTQLVKKKHEKTTTTKQTCVYDSLQRSVVGR